MLGSKESDWGTKVPDLPPSLGMYVGFGNGTTNGTGTYRRRAIRFTEPTTNLRTDAMTGGAYWASVEG